MSLILGISAYYHDSAATLMKDGEILCAFQEERFSRVKQDKRFPYRAIKACFDYTSLSLIDVNKICYYEDPELKYRRIISTFRRNVPKGLGLFAREYRQYRANRKLLDTLRREIGAHFGAFNAEITCTKHHQSHAASAYYPSPFASAAVLFSRWRRRMVDRIRMVGPWRTTKTAPGASIFEILFGLLYSAFTYFCGFKVDLGEYKLDRTRALRPTYLRRRDSAGDHIRH